MKFKERLFHAILFEIGAVLVTSFAMLTADMGEGKREDRSVILRIFHTVSFEAGLLIATIPMIAYALNLTLWQALVTDIALTVLITLYGFLFNLAYDHLRLKFVEE